MFFYIILNLAEKNNFDIFDSWQLSKFDVLQKYAVAPTFKY